VGKTISLNIGALESPRNVKISAQFFDNKKMRFAKILGEFHDVFAWYYRDLRGFYPGLTQHAIHIKEGMKPDRQKQRSINSAFKATFQRELENSLKAGIIFLVYSKWISNWIHVSKTTCHIRTCINFCTFMQAIMRILLPSLSMKMVLQQVVESQLGPLFDSFLFTTKPRGKG
jgi:hypothetical protein